MLKRYKKISLEKTLWSNSILTIVLSIILGCWLLIDSFNAYSAAKERKIQFNSIYKMTTAFNTIGRERDFSNELILAEMKDKQKAWDTLKQYRKEVDIKLNEIDKNILSSKDWESIYLSLNTARQAVDSYKDKLAIDPEHTKPAIYSMVNATETFQQIIRQSSLKLVKKDNSASGSLLQLLILSNIRDYTGRLATPFLVTLHFNSLLTVKDVEKTTRLLERLDGAWDVMEAIPDDIPSSANEIFEQKLALSQQQFNLKSLPLINKLNHQENTFNSNNLSAYEFSQQYRSGLENIVNVQEYYLNELFKFHNSSEKKAAIKLIVVLTAMILIIVLVISLSLYIQKRLLKPLLVLNKVADDLTKGTTSPELSSLIEKGELQSLFNSFDILDYQIRQRQNLTDKLAKESAEDPLTGIANRRKFKKFAQKLLSNAHNNFPVTMIILDLDYFKKINDTWGHPFGDKVLIKVSQILKHSVPDDAMVARLGGEEFVIMLPQKSSNTKITELLHDIQHQINTSSFVTENNISVDITASFGVSETTTNDLTRLLSNTDRALYKAKEAGRNCIRYHIEL